MRSEPELIHIRSEENKSSGSVQQFASLERTFEQTNGNSQAVQTDKEILKKSLLRLNKSLGKALPRTPMKSDVLAVKTKSPRKLSRDRKTSNLAAHTIKSLKKEHTKRYQKKQLIFEYKLNKLRERMTDQLSANTEEYK